MLILYTCHFEIPHPKVQATLAIYANLQFIKPIFNRIFNFTIKLKKDQHGIKQFFTKVVPHILLILFLHISPTRGAT
nr:hypothetical transcript [Hymenolepis microstoma]